MIFDLIITAILSAWASFAVAAALIAFRQPKSRRERLDDLDAEIDRQQSRAAKADQRKRGEIYAKLLERVK